MLQTSYYKLQLKGGSSFPLSLSAAYLVVRVFLSNIIVPYNVKHFEVTAVVNRFYI